MPASPLAAVAFVIGTAAFPPTVPHSAAVQAGTCRDPWITELVRATRGRPPAGQGETGECNINLYGHTWSSKADLQSKVQQSLRALDAAGLEFTDNGNVLHDIRFGVRMPGHVYVGPRATAPIKNSVIGLPNNYVMVVERRCPPGTAGFGTSGGCVRGGVNGG